MANMGITIISHMVRKLSYVLYRKTKFHIMVSDIITSATNTRPIVHNNLYNWNDPRGYEPRGYQNHNCYWL